MRAQGRQPKVEELGVGEGEQEHFFVAPPAGFASDRDRGVERGVAIGLHGFAGQQLGTHATAQERQGFGPEILLDLVCHDAKYGVLARGNESGERVYFAFAEAGLLHQAT